MSNYLRIILFAICLVIIPAGLFAQTGDICSKLPAVESLRSLNANGASAGTNSDIIVQQMRERADMQARQEQERATWTAQMFPVKYLDSAETLKALCIFSAEIVPQPTLHMISVRAAQTNMAAIGDAIKRLDVPQIGPKSAELTIYVLVGFRSGRDLEAVSRFIETRSRSAEGGAQLQTVLSFGYSDGNQRRQSSRSDER